MKFVYDFEGVGRIVSAVQKAGGDVPPEFNAPDIETVRRERLKLAISISGAFAWARSHKVLTDDRRAEKRYASLEQAAKLTRRLLAVVKGEQNAIERAFAQHTSVDDDGVGLVDAMRTLALLPGALDAERARFAAAGLDERAPLNTVSSTSNADSGTAGDALIMRLDHVFRCFFGEPTIPQPEVGEPEGPFLAFVMTVREMAGDPMQPDSVRRVWDRARKLQDRD